VFEYPDLSHLSLYLLDVCLLGSDTKQHFDVAAQMPYRAHHGWTESYEKSIPMTSLWLRAQSVHPLSAAAAIGPNCGVSRVGMKARAYFMGIISSGRPV
jgi:hypothetical protein